MATTYKHLSASPIYRVRSVPQLVPDVKPVGFWVSSGDAWKEWCLDNEIFVEELVHEYDVTVDLSNVLLINNDYKLAEFDQEFGIEPTRFLRFIDWKRVATYYQGIIIDPYSWKHRLGGLIWYYSWDCASGCIWDAAAIVGLELSNTNTNVK